MNELANGTLNKMISERKFNAVYQWLKNEHYMVMLSLAESYLRSRELAEELVLDVLYRTWRKKEGIEHIKDLRRYLLTSVKHSCYRQLMKQQREKELFVSTDQISKEFSDYIAIDPEKLFLTSELSKLIGVAIDNLPPRCKQIYRLIREQGLKNKDVAAQLNISVNTIDVQLAIAAKKIHAVLNNYNSIGTP
ncbi:sigma-70 family RNA polymerase sigma factor [Olivibacter sp. SDN3]|uniref:sigma-70 family RNA polymerase sigma factor n=1 Tax=Olivibacter sp. SDN3 TaxID=2764720 RepID=UPI001650E5F7|nr:sigma-70 family RNA polymerase sigma factor [Olivibacter sp. SDN3]QNL48183.1 sigma-70 family RNA polymerase sigma factor [Olivibacter sp. SDN3]